MGAADLFCSAKLLLVVPLKFHWVLPWQPCIMLRTWNIFPLLLFTVFLIPTSWLIRDLRQSCSCLISMHEPWQRTWVLLEEIGPFFWLWCWLVIWVLFPLSSASVISLRVPGCKHRITFPCHSSEMLNWCNDSSLRACLAGVVMRVEASDIRFKSPIFIIISGKQNLIFSFYWRGGMYSSWSVFHISSVIQKGRLGFNGGVKWVDAVRCYCIKYTTVLPLMQQLIRNRWVKAVLIDMYQVRTLETTCSWLNEKWISQFTNAWGREENREEKLTHQNKVNGKRSFKWRW